MQLYRHNYCHLLLLFFVELSCDSLCLESALSYTEKEKEKRKQLEINTKWMINQLCDAVWGQTCTAINACDHV